MWCAALSARLSKGPRAAAAATSTDNAGGGSGGSQRQGAALDFGIVYTNEHVGERKRKPSHCSRCVAAGKPDTVSSGHNANNAHCPSR